MARSFDGRVVMVTGGNRGIGLATAQAFADEGAAVATMARSAVRESGPSAVDDALSISGDVRIAADCERAVSAVVDRFGRLDILVNSAGIIYRNRTVEQHSEEEWDATFDTNVKGAFLMCRSAMPALRAVRGNIVNVSSYVGLVGFPGASAYAASKAALINFTRTLALDHAPEGIRANCVCPGSVETDMIRAAWAATGDADAAAQAWAAKHPLGRVATAGEIAPAILFLAGDSASFITGVPLPVDGGITAG